MTTFLKGTQNEVMSVEANKMQAFCRYLEASFAVHEDLNWSSMTLEKVAEVTTKKKFNARSSMEAKLVVVDNILAKMLSTKRFMECQRLQQS